MIEFFHASISLVNLPFTVLLVLIVLYWLSVIIGALDIELFDLDLSQDMDMDHSGGFVHSFLSLLNIGEVPVMVVISVMILVGWCFSMLSNYYLNSGMSLLIGAGLLVPNFIVSLVMAGLVTRPLRALFSTLDQEDTHQKILNRVGKVTTSQVTPTFGQLEIETRGAPILVNVRTTEDTVLKKGDKAIIYDEDKDKGIYFVEKYDDNF